MSRIVTFNTGRQYSLRGQRIACAQLDDGRVMFADADRGIDGITKWKTGPRTPERLQHFVMMAYDHGEYTSGAWQPGIFAAEQDALDDLLATLEAAAEAL